VQRGLIDNGTLQKRVAVLDLSMQGWERAAHGCTQVTANTDLVARGRWLRTALRAGHRPGALRLLVREKTFIGRLRREL
jgi:hypothetical protein